ncbi:hypothetical protein JW968_02595 [Candidatus Woesearchaeota archaeon]|nr:hypothetical protein [Candidatus Woesearchaeota archaeon]
MKTWNDIEHMVYKVSPDIAKSRSILKMANARIEANNIDHDRYPSLVVEKYYKIIKELIVALMAIDGFKTVSHEALVLYLGKFYNDFIESEIALIDQMRIKRNQVVYEGRFVPKEYLRRNEEKLKEIISKLMKIIDSRLTSSSFP